MAVIACENFSFFFRKIGLVIRAFSSNLSSKTKYRRCGRKNNVFSSKALTKVSRCCFLFLSNKCVNIFQCKALKLKTLQLHFFLPHLDGEELTSQWKIAWIWIRTALISRPLNLAQKWFEFKMKAPRRW